MLWRHLVSSPDFPATRGHIVTSLASAWAEHLPFCIKKQLMVAWARVQFRFVYAVIRIDSIMHVTLALLWWFLLLAWFESVINKNNRKLNNLYIVCISRRMSRMRCQYSLSGLCDVASHVGCHACTCFVIAIRTLHVIVWLWMSRHVTHALLWTISINLC